jgi:hypothetical protein
MHSGPARIPVQPQRHHPKATLRSDCFVARVRRAGLSACKTIE